MLRKLIPAALLPLCFGLIASATPALAQQAPAIHVVAPPDPEELDSRWGSTFRPEPRRPSHDHTAADVPERDTGPPGPRARFRSATEQADQIGARALNRRRLRTFLCPPFEPGELYVSIVNGD